MSCFSMIETVNGSSNNVNANGNIPLGSTIRRYGKNLALSGDGIVAAGFGYYNINAIFTFTSSVAGDVTIQAFADNEPIPGAVGTVTAAVDSKVIIPLQGEIRNQNCGDATTITFRFTDPTVTAVGTFINTSIIVAKR